MEDLMNSKTHYQLPPELLVKKALERKEGKLTNTGAFVAQTGKYTGRSPRDKFIVQDEKTGSVDWGNINQPFNSEDFDKIYKKMLDFIKEREKFVFDGFVGADENYQVPVRVITEFAWHNLFTRHLLIRPEKELNQFSPEFTVIDFPSFKADPVTDKTNSETFILLNFTKKLVLIGGTEYAGEIKKSLFSIMNFLLPKKNVLPMHCSANVGTNGDVALFFGLSGTGKTTLSTEPERKLIGDDEHGWDENGVFNFEGGCYAKTINLSKEKEPEIFQAVRNLTILENVVIDDKGVPNYADGSLTENTRAAYPIQYLDNIQTPSTAGHPKTIIFLTADAFGVLPPISKLTKEQIEFYFLNGYTSKLAGTERGVTEPELTFSSCFGAPFLPLHPKVYSKMLMEKVEQFGSDVYLVNTGWTGGGYGVGKRMDLSVTRRMVRAAISGELKNVDYLIEPIFGLLIPKSIGDVPSQLLNPANTWSDKTLYEEEAKKLKTSFFANFQKFS